MVSNSDRNTVENFYVKFHEKFKSEFKFLNFFVKQIRLSFAFVFERQMRITVYFKSTKKHVNMKAHCHINVKAHGHTNDSDVIEQKTQNWKFIARSFTDFQKLRNSINQNARRSFFSLEINQSKNSLHFKVYANQFIRFENVHVCRCCKQRFILKNLLYKHLRHCFLCISRWFSVAEKLSI